MSLTLFVIDVYL